MAYDPGLAQILRDDLHPLPVTEKRMMGGLCFLLNGHMVCCALGEGALFRPGKAAQAEALRLEGVGTMSLTGRVMTGFVAATAETVADDSRRAQLLRLSLDFVATLPPK